jgi:catechol 2,3-dioxygenase-like lactoylglutathione lyase family enzyme
MAGVDPRGATMGWEDTMGIGMTKVLHVKIPVTDLQRSVLWYCTLLDLELSMEFVEQGTLRGAALKSPEGGFAFALRDREVCASRPDLTGFDPFALHISTREALQEIINRCDRLSIEHTGIQDRGPNEAVVDVPDPDGTVLRFRWVGESNEDNRFLGLAFDSAGEMSFYDTPRLETPWPEATRRAVVLVVEGGP